MRQLLLFTAATSLSAFALTACSSAMADQSSAFAAAADQSSFKGDTIKVEDFIGTLVIKTGPGMKQAVSVDQGDVVADGDLDAVQLRQEGDSFTIVGEEVKVKSCNSSNGKYTMQLKGQSKRPLKDFPTVTITAPSSITLDLNILGGKASAGDVEVADLHVYGCGDVMLGDVEKTLKTHIKGSGDVEAGNVGQLEVSIKGSGDVRVGDSDGAADLDIAGSGDIRVGRIGGSFSTGIRGSGDVAAAGGTGAMQASIRGSGDIRITEASFSSAKISVGGSGDVKVGGTVGDLEVSVAGSGDIRIEEATGDIDVNRMGSGDIVVNGKRWTKKGWQ